MNIDTIRDYCLSKKGVSEDFPFDADTLVFKVMGKMFVLLPLEKWEKGEAFINLKCDPDYASELREAYDSIEPGFHMSKTHWNSLYLYKNELNPKFVCELIDHSYEMVVKGMTKKLRDALNNL